MTSTLYSMTHIGTESEEGGGGALTPTDQVLVSLQMLEASLMGYCLFLALIIDRLHHYVRELRGLRKSMEAVMKTNRALEESNNGSADDIKAKEKEIASLNEQIKVLKSESDAKLKEAIASEADASALKKRSEGFLQEYDRM
ncbi:uncharacterized protein A4U43_C06F10840 [Asparagus officinalis]|uniref:Endoplasmic reticulum transmembrane protein n=1 Tax=Asparagus officinalis TaxID=4686 RepID=A0A5P1EL02_ASPOF|nr:uncharacterized protein A4U43_C06F10840 [Asparagus officinalis]